MFISTIQTTDGTCFEIKDDGVGIEAETLEMILTDEREDKGVGLMNIHNRLCRLYGRGLEITSEVGIGTCVKFVIPGCMESEDPPNTNYLEVRNDR